MSEYICANEGIDKHLSREPKRAADHWAKFQKLLKADKVFSGMAKYLRRFTAGIKPFALFVSASTTCHLTLTFVQVQKHARSARGNDSMNIRDAVANAFEEVELDSCTIKPIPSKVFVKRGNTQIKFNSLCTSCLLVNIEDRDRFDRNPQE